MRTVWAGVAAIGGLIMLAMLWRVIGRDRRLRSVTGIADVVAGGPGLLVLHIGVYAAYMLYARTTTGLNQLDFRLLNPIYLPLVISALVILDRVLAAPDDERQPTWAKAAGGTAFAWAGLNLLVGVGMIAYFDDLARPVRRQLRTGRVRRRAGERCPRGTANGVRGVVEPAERPVRIGRRRRVEPAQHRSGVQRSRRRHPAARSNVEQGDYPSCGSTSSRTTGISPRSNSSGALRSRAARVGGRRDDVPHRAQVASRPAQPRWGLPKQNRRAQPARLAGGPGEVPGPREATQIVIQRSADVAVARGSSARTAP